jgi:hypothetical protein
MTIDQLIDALQSIKAQNISCTNRLDAPVVIVGRSPVGLYSGKLLNIGVVQWRGEVCIYVEGKLNLPIIDTTNGS